MRLLGRDLHMSKLLVRTILLCFMILSTGTLLGGMVIHAQEPDGGEEPIVIAASGRLNLTFQQLGYDTLGLSRERSERYYRVDLPGNFRILSAGNYLDLVTYHLPDVPAKPSVLKVRMNGNLLYAFPLTGTNASSNTVRINLSEGLLRTGSTSIQLNLDTSTTCEDPGAIVDVFVDRTSTLSLGYQQSPYPTDLSRYPYPFVEKSLIIVPVTLVLPDRPTADDLTAAATVAASLGRMSRGAIDLTAVLGSELDPEIRSNHHLIVIGAPGHNALLDDLALPLPIDDTALEPGQGVLEEIQSPWNGFRLILVVSGLDDEAVLEAGYALNCQAHFLGMRGPVAVVTRFREPSSPAVLHTPSLTLAALGYEDQIVYGAQPQDYAYHFTLPLGWQLEAPPFFVFKFSHADILDPDDSVVDVELNSVPIGSTFLNADNADEGELTISLPGRLLRAGNNRLQVGVEMNFPDSDNAMKCLVLYDERAWMVISSESEIFLPYSTMDLRPDLSLFPYPFAQSSGFDQTMFVLPDQPSSQMVNNLVQLALLLGSSSQAECMSAYVAYPSEMGEEAQKAHHLILLGRPTENALLRTVNAYLPQPFAPDSDVLQPLVVDNVAFLPDPARDAGLLELVDSPWDGKHSLLAVTGTTDEGVRLTVQTLLEPSGALEGNLAVVEPAFLPEEPNQVSTYSIDTRPPVTASGEVLTSDTVSEDDLILSAERWWK